MYNHNKAQQSKNRVHIFLGYTVYAQYAQIFLHHQIDASTVDTKRASKPGFYKS